MYLFTNALLVCVLCVALYSADDLQLGSATNGQLVHQETVKLDSIPLTTRIENVFYSSKNKIIKSISAIDKDKSKAKPTIMAGGVGSSFVNLRLTSEKGKALHYLVQVFV